MGDIVKDEIEESDTGSINQQSLVRGTWSNIMKNFPTERVYTIMRPGKGLFYTFSRQNWL